MGLLNGLLLFPFTHLAAQKPAEWHDPSLHKIEFVTVNGNVRLEVLDWGGSGRALVLLSGLGGTAHLLDDFAPKLSSRYHVYGITHRGFGASSVPASGYDADRLGDDVLAVMTALKLTRPMLAGLSFGGEELSSIGSRHPERVAGLIYLDAAYAYAFDNGKGMTMADFFEVLQGAPVFPSPGAADLASFTSYRDWLRQTAGVLYPEAELRQLWNSTPEGSVGNPRTAPTVPPAILKGVKKFSDIRVPVLAIYADPPDLPNWLKTSEHADVRSAALAFSEREAALVEKQAKAFENGVTGARVVRLANANHWVFQSNEAEVLREIHGFVDGIK